MTDITDYREPGTHDVGPRSHVGRLAGEIGPYAGIIVVLCAMAVAFTVTQPRFATYENVLNILETNAVLLVVSCGLTVVLLVRGFDISTSSVVAFTGVFLAIGIEHGVPAGAMIAILVVAGFGIGAIANGYPIAKHRLNFFVVTIATASIIRSVGLVATGGNTHGLYTQEFLKSLGNGSVLHIPYAVIVSIATTAAVFVTTRYTGLGRMMYAVGGNEEAARIAGINVTAVRITAYAICSGLAAVAGVLLTGRLTSADPQGAAGLELTAAAAVLLGGTSFDGGSGSVIGTLFGVLFLGVLSNGLTLIGVSAFWQGIVTGGVLLAAVGLDRLRRSR